MFNPMPTFFANGLKFPKFDFLNMSSKVSFMYL